MKVSEEKKEEKSIYERLLFLGKVFFFAFLLTYAASGGQKTGLSSMGGLFGMYLSVITLALIKRERSVIKPATIGCTPRFTLRIYCNDKPAIHESRIITAYGGNKE